MEASAGGGGMRHCCRTSQINIGYPVPILACRVCAVLPGGGEPELRAGWRANTPLQLKILHASNELKGKSK